MVARKLVPSELNPPPNITVIHSASQFHLLKDFFDRNKTFGFDIETNVADTFVDRKIRTIQFGNKTEQYVIDLLSLAGHAELLLEQGWRKPPTWAEPLVNLIKPVLESKEYLKVGVNLEFEYIQMLWCLGIRCFNFWDNLLVEKLIYAGKVHFFQSDFWGMDDMVLRYCRLEIDKTQQTTFNLTDPLTEEQIVYGALDTRFPMAIRAGQIPTVEKLELNRAAQIENDAIPAFGDMHVNGIYLDEAAWMEIVAEVEIQHAANVERLDTFFVEYVGTKYEPPITNLEEIEAKWRECPNKTPEDKARRNEYRQAFYAARRELSDWNARIAKGAEGHAAINYGSHGQILDALRKMGFGPKKLPNTNDKVLKTLEGEPVIDALREYRTTAKLLDNYGKNWLEYINKETRRVHSRINQLGAATGRTSSTNPNVQNIPKGSNYRGAFRARPGYVFISVDMSGAELRILAELSGEPLMVDAFANGWDVHSIGAEMLFGNRWLEAAEEGCAFYAKKQKCKCKLHKILRDQVKAVNFGVVYGKEYKALAEDLKISENEAKQLLEQWRSTYKVAWAWLQKQGNSVKMNLVCRTMSGRVRYWIAPDWERCKEIAKERAKKDGKNPDAITSREITRVYHGIYGSIEREGKNTPMQGGNADIAKLAMGAGYDREGAPFMWHLLPKYEAELCCMVHDEFDIEAPEEHANAVVAMVGDCIVRAGKELMKRVQMEFEAMVGDRWQK
jgi:DNA polymerase I-like protein with 3'-5' exonuclease and polymerase domains